MPQRLLLFAALVLLPVASSCAQGIAECNARPRQDSPQTAEQANAIHALLTSGRLEEALAQAKVDAAQAPASATLQTALAEVYYRRGELGPFVTAINLALKLDPCSAEAHFDAFQFFELSALHRKALDQLTFAHSLVPHDARVDNAWNRQTSRKNECTVAAASPASAVIPFGPKMEQSEIAHGASIAVKLNGIGLPLVLDSADPGITIGEAEAKRLGLVPEQSFTSAPHAATGSSAISGYTSHLKTLQVGGITLENCPINVYINPAVEGGGIGLQPFGGFLITLDGRRRRMLLDPLPPLPASEPPDGPHDRYIAPAMQSWLRFYHPANLPRILLPVTLGAAGTHLFIFDTGAGRSHIDPDAAREVTQVSRDTDTPVSGYGGVENDVFRANRVTIQLGSYTRTYQPMLSLSRATKSAAAGLRISGILGFDWVADSIVRIDYRDQLIEFAPNHR